MSYETKIKNEWHGHPMRIQMMENFATLPQIDPLLVRSIGAAVDVAYSEGYLAAIRMVASLHMENAQ